MPASSHKSHRPYRGRIAPSPTGFLHLGHARTFWTAQYRARQSGGALLLRIEDIDWERCRPEYRDALIEDLAWFGFQWDEGPDVGGPCAPYIQGARRAVYEEVWQKLFETGWIYPCRCSRKDVLQALSAPHGESRGMWPANIDDEPIYPGSCRSSQKGQHSAPCGITWRFRVPDGEELVFSDGNFGEQRAVCGRDFGDFVVWRRDDIPAYQLAVVADDIAMGITEVVRGKDLLTSTFRQMLIYRALGAELPAYYHCELVTDEKGERLAKRNDALSLRTLRGEGTPPAAIRRGWEELLQSA